MYSLFSCLLCCLLILLSGKFPQFLKNSENLAFSFFDCLCLYSISFLSCRYNTFSYLSEKIISFERFSFVPCIVCFLRVLFFFFFAVYFSPCRSFSSNVLCFLPSWVQEWGTKQIDWLGLCTVGWRKEPVFLLGDPQVVGLFLRSVQFL